MRLARLVLTGFRCFGTNTSISFGELTAFVGANGSGKTAVMQALAKLFGQDPRDRSLHRADFHVPKGVRPEDQASAHLSIEAILGFPELRAPEDNAARQSVPPVFEQMAVEPDTGDPYVRIRLTGSWQRGTTPDGDIDETLEFIASPEGTSPEAEDRKRVHADQRSHIQVLYVPATRDPTSQLRHQAGTLLHRLLAPIEWTPGLATTLKTHSQQVDSAFHSEAGLKHVVSTIRDHWHEFHADARFSEVEFALSKTELSDYLRALEVAFKPTPEDRAYTTPQLGDGLRSLLYFSLVSSLLSLEHSLLAHADKPPEGLGVPPRVPRLTILAVEEPENHLSPALLGRAVENLLRISKKANGQVAFASHTPALLGRVDPSSVRHLRLDPATDCTVVSAIALPTEADEAYKYVKEAVRSYPELYFARVVVLGEGDSEQLIIPRVLQLDGESLDRSEIAVVPLGGRHVNHFWRLLEQLQIPHATLLDLDRERLGGGWGRIKYAFQQLKALRGLKTSQLAADFDGTVVTLDFEKIDEKAADMTQYLAVLEAYNLFYSQPLDLDFMMLQSYRTAYTTVPPGRGPRLPDKQKEAKKYEERLVEATTRVLKEGGGNGSSFAATERELFPWYSYLFLDRGKPSTHILALSRLDNDALVKGLPLPLASLGAAVVRLLGRENPDSDLSSTVAFPRPSLRVARRSDADG